MEKILKEVGIGDIFKIAGFEFIKFYEADGNTVAVAKDCWFESKFGANNNFAESKILKKLKEEYLPKLEEAIGADNIIEHEVDLLSLDGSDKWGKIKSKISLPTFDFYRKNVKIFDKNNPKKWWWLSTPETTSEHIGNDDWVTCASSLGGIGYFDSYCNIGVRPFCIFSSCISISFEE